MQPPYAGALWPVCAACRLLMRVLSSTGLVYAATQGPELPPKSNSVGTPGVNGTVNGLAFAAWGGRIGGVGVAGATGAASTPRSAARGRLPNLKMSNWLIVCRS